MYFTQKKLSEELGVCRQTVKKYSKFVEEHPERYGSYGVCGRLISLRAVLDAMKFYRAFELGLEKYIPPFESF